MKKLVTVVNKEVVSLKDEDTTLLYPLKDFCVGLENEFDINEIDDFCLVNRILEDKDLEKLETMLKTNHIKGIVFDDLGILEVIKDLDIKKILLLDHLATNYRSINYYLDYVDSVVVSNDLTEDEIKNILKNAKKPLVINVFGLKTLMYSRRSLLSNYELYHSLDKNNNISAKIEEKDFKIIENEYGTKFYAYPYYEASSLIGMDNVLYFWYDPIFLDIDKIKDALNNNFENIKTSRLFLDEKTIYKVGDIHD